RQRLHRRRRRVHPAPPTGHPWAPPNGGLAGGGAGSDEEGRGAPIMSCDVRIHRQSQGRVAARRPGVAADRGARLRGRGRFGPPGARRVPDRLLLDSPPAAGLRLLGPALPPRRSAARLRLPRAPGQPEGARFAVLPRPSLVGREHSVRQRLLLRGAQLRLVGVVEETERSSEMKQRIVGLLLLCLLAAAAAGCAGREARTHILIPSMEVAWPGVRADAERGGAAAEDLEAMDLAL